MSYASQVEAAPSTSPYAVAPRASAASRSSSSSTAAPSAMQKPSRSRSNGREQPERDSAVIVPNAASVVGVIDASAPPASTTSHRPSATIRAPAAIEWVPARARGGQRLAGAAPALSQRDDRRAGVGHHHRDGVRRDAGRPAGGQHADLGFQGGDTADPGAQLDAGPARVDRRQSAGVLQRHLGGGDGEVGEPVGVPGLLARQPRLRVEVVDPPLTAVCRRGPQPLPERRQPDPAG